MLKKGFCTILLLIFFMLQLVAQPSNELGLTGGGMYYIGDLNRLGHLQPDLTSPGFGIQFRYNLNPRISWNYTFTYGKVKGTDALQDDPWANNRNLSFESNIFELATRVEFNYFEFDTYNKSRYLSPFLFIGLGLYRFNPTAELNGNIYELQPLQTEGQQSPYRLIQPNIPFGMGLKFKISERFNGALEYGMRFLFTDYLDDVSGFYPDPNNLSTVGLGLSNKAITQDGVNGKMWGSQRGSGNPRDWFGFVGLTISYRISKDPSECYFNPMKL